MKHRLFDLPIAQVKAAERPSVTALHSQHDGSFLCGLSFCEPLLFRIKKNGDALDFESFDVGNDAVAVTQGLRSNVSGDTAFALLHGGFLPGFLKGFAGGDFTQKSGKELLDFLFANDGGLGATVRHSIVQISNNELSVRRSKDPGAILDVAHIGDFIFGLVGTSIWREPYLNSEKRETIRKDLGKNFGLHRDDLGNIWLVAANERLQRMGQTDVKATPTVQKLSSAEFEVSAASETDGWLYASTKDSKDLYRIRRNPISFEDEAQKIKSFDRRVTGLAVLDREENPVLIITLEDPKGAELLKLDLVKPEDPELPPPAGTPVSVGRLEGIQCVSSLTPDRSDAAKKTLWGGESRLGCGIQGFQPTRLIQISEI